MYTIETLSGICRLIYSLFTHQVVYQEVETFNGDSRTRVVTETHAVEELYPGRNYSITVAAVSNSIESDPASQIYIATSKRYWICVYNSQFS